MTHQLILAGLLLPLAIDTFALGAALGILGVKPAERLRVGLILAGFEAAMPVVGFLLGGALGGALGRFADYPAILFLFLAGGLLLRPGGEDAEGNRLRLLAKARGPAVIFLGLGVSVDELTIGFSLGLLGFSLVAAVVWIAAQALIAAQAGMRLGSKLGEAVRERVEQLAGIALIAMAGVLLVLKLSSHL